MSDGREGGGGGEEGEAPVQPETWVSPEVRELLRNWRPGQPLPGGSYRRLGRLRQPAQPPPQGGEAAGV